MQPYPVAPRGDSASLFGLVASLVQARWPSHAQAPGPGPSPQPHGAAGEAGGPELHLSSDLRELLGLHADRPGADGTAPFAAADGEPAGGALHPAPRRRRHATAATATTATTTATSANTVATTTTAAAARTAVHYPDNDYDPTGDTREQIAARYAILWHTAPVRRHANPQAAMRAWRSNVVAALRHGGADVQGIDTLSRAFDNMDSAFDLLKQRLQQARARLQGDATLRRRLRKAGVGAAEVSGQLDVFANSVVRLLQARSLSTPHMLGLVPTPHALIERGLREAISAAREEAYRPRWPTTTTTRPTTATTTTTTAASTTTTAVPQYRGQPFPQIRDRAEALQALRRFHKEMRERLPQFQGSVDDLTALSEGRVAFASLQDMALSVPYALLITRPQGYGTTRQDYRHDAIYRPGGPARTSVWSPSFEGMDSLVARDPDNHHQVLVSSDSRMLIRTGIYTDAFVEDAKQKMWWLICMEANLAAARLRTLQRD